MSVYTFQCLCSLVRPLAHTWHCFHCFRGGILDLVQISVSSFSLFPPPPPPPPHPHSYESIACILWDFQSQFEHFIDTALFTLARSHTNGKQSCESDGNCIMLSIKENVRLFSVCLKCKHFEFKCSLIHSLSLCECVSLSCMHTHAYTHTHFFSLFFFVWVKKCKHIFCSKRVHGLIYRQKSFLRFLHATWYRNKHSNL